MSSEFILSFESPAASLQNAGGKGASLAAMTRSGLPVPAGFIVTTDAYRTVVDHHGLVTEALAPLSESPSDERLQEIENEMRAAFLAAEPSPELISAVREAYVDLGGMAVAVRSSATAEDLPDSSFAGQQDTLLNVHGEDELWTAIRSCWASLWNARAIAYRNRMGIEHATVAMGVVVQSMVAAEVSGILFTANPTNGDRDQVLVNASYGLGEAIVSGQVTPDTYVVSRDSLEVQESLLGEKQTMVVAAQDQGTSDEEVLAADRGRLSLSGQSVQELVELALTVEPLFDSIPLDIEWAVANDFYWLLQARPVTNLPDPPLKVTWEPPKPKQKLIRRQVVENMPDPLCPLFDDLYLSEGLEAAIDDWLTSFHVPMSIDDLIDRPLFRTVNGYAYSLASYRKTWGLFWAIPRILTWYFTWLPRLVKHVIEVWRDRDVPRYLNEVQRAKELDVSEADDVELLSAVRKLVIADARYWFSVSMILGIAKITDGLFHMLLTSRLIPGKLTSGEFLRGYATKTHAAQQYLEKIATQIRQDASLREQMESADASEIPQALQQSDAGLTVLRSLEDYFATYGHRVYSMDFIEPTQGEDRLPIYANLLQLVRQGNFDVNVRLAATVKERDERIQETLKKLSPTRKWLFEKTYGWASKYAPYREDAMFYVGAGWPTARKMLLELGGRLCSAGRLTDPEDVFFLQAEELQRVCEEGTQHTGDDLSDRAEKRRKLREARKGLHPPGMVPDDGPFRMGFINLSILETQKRNAADSDVLNGFAVSPGEVTGIASVIESPAEFSQMVPNTILVCSTTTPAWTPLFDRALALVTDIGGILAHGSIVAREYGIPAVLGTGNATQRIVTGQKITVDGTSGTVTLH